MKILLVVNPAASAVKPKVCAEIRGALAAEHELEVTETEERDHATELARNGVAGGCEAVAVLGGDGTLNEAANALVGTNAALLPLPGGSTNVFARTVGLANNPRKAVHQLVAALRDGSPRSIALGQVNGRYFLFHTGVGFDAAVVEQVEKRSQLKRTVGQAVFVVAAFDAWFRHYDHHRPSLTARFPDGSSVEGYMCICMNSDPYTYLGPRPLSLAPEADGQRGLAAVTLRELQAGSTLAIVGSAMGSGARLRRHDAVDRHTDLGSFTVGGPEPVPYQVDGDYLGTADELSFSHHPGVLNVVTP